MMYIYVFLLLISSLIFVLELVYSKGNISNAGEMIFDKFIRKCRFFELIIRNRKMLKIENSSEAYEWGKSSAKRMIMLTLAVVMVGSIIGILGTFKESGGDIYLKRSSYDGDEISYQLKAKMSDESIKNILVTVSPITLSQEEMDKLYEEGFDKAFEEFTGNDEQVIRDKVNRISSIEGYPFTLRWDIEGDEIIDTEGNVLYENVNEEMYVRVTLEMTFNEDSRIQERVLSLPVKVESAEEQELESLMNSLTEIDQEDTENDTVHIPSDISGVSLYQENEDNNEIIIFIIAVAVVFIWVRFYENQKDELSHKRKSILKDYPELINRLILYISAGLTIKGAFIKISEIRESGYHPLNEEIKAMIREINSGLPEETAYENLGIRLDENSYIRLFQLLNQNLTKGSADVIRMLKLLLADALKERQDKAKILGEEASTKLLFPMILLLVVSMAIVIIPALLSFGI